MAFRKQRGRKKSLYWYYDFIHKDPAGQRRRVHGCTRETHKDRALQVEAKIRQRLELGEPDPVDDVTFEQLSEEYLKLHVKNKKASGYFENVVTVMGRHFGKQLVSEIGVKEAEEFLVAIRTRAKRPASPATCNRYRSTARHIWNKAQAWNHAPKGVNPWKEVARQKERPREFFLTEKQTETLLKALPEWMQPIVMFALHTGQRRGTILGLQWSDVDLERGLVTFRNTKNGDDVTIPINPSLVSMLKEAGSRFAGERVFPVELQKVRSQWRRVVRKLDLCTIEVAPDGKVRKVWMRIHDLRHSAASFMVQAGRSLFEVQKVLGHRDPRMTQRYAHLAPEHLRGTVAALDWIGRKEKSASACEGGGVEWGGGNRVDGSLQEK